METRIATQRLISSVWTLVYRDVLNDSNDIEILAYSRKNPKGNELEGKVDLFRIVESSGRVATEVMFSTYYPNGFNCYRRAKVINPKYVFSYPDTELPEITPALDKEIADEVNRLFVANKNMSPSEEEFNTLYHEGIRRRGYDVQDYIKTMMAIGCEHDEEI